jgi:3',5'-cyclic AMP phosphodiesterase CpdA
LLIAHISDLHLNSFYNESTYNRLEYLFKKLKEDKVEHLIITGDLTDNASEKDFLFLRKLLRKYNFLSGEKLTIIAGNHDIFGGVQRAEDILTFPEKCRKMNYIQKLNEFTGYFPEALENCFFISSNSYYPFAKVVGPALVIGVNSIAPYSKISNPFASNGEINITQFNEINSILKTKLHDLKFKLILIHHHFNKYKARAISSLGNVWQNIEKQTMKLKNKRRLFNLFNEFNVDLVLHGHLHESKEYYRKGIRFLNAGATLKNERKGIRFLNAGATLKNEKENNVKVNYVRLLKKEIEIEHFNVPVKDKLPEFSRTSNDFVRLLNYSESEKERISF